MQVAGLMNCWLLWLAVFIHNLRFIVFCLIASVAVDMDIDG